MVRLDSRLKRIAASLPIPDRLPCELCRDYPMHPVYYAGLVDPQLYADSQMTTPAEQLWPCRACGHQPHAIRAIVVNYVPQEHHNDAA